jgi:2-amino-4-hydroxy-6-hydroxymethyldihydropteridine diphosphokinase
VRGNSEGQMQVFIGLGSNLGERKENITRAITLLRGNPQVTIKVISSLIESEPQGGPPQENYLNGVIEIETSLSAQNLLVVLMDVEARLGRVRGVKNAPRTIDLDILLYGEERINEGELIIPHPRMGERRFVMEPLAEIAPQRAAEIKGFFAGVSRHESHPAK